MSQERRNVDNSVTLGHILYNLPVQSKKLVRKIENISKKHINAEASVSFNLVCVDENILPGYTNINLHHENARNRQSTLQFRMELVKEELQEKKTTAANLLQERNILLQEWEKDPTPPNMKQDINDKMDLILLQHQRKVESTNIKKLSKLYGGNIKLPKPQKGYVNLTDVTLTPQQDDLLNMGLNCHYISKPGPHRKRLEIELLLDDIDKLRSKGKITTSPTLNHTLITEASKTRGSFRSNIINKEHITAAKELKNNNEIIIRRADKSASLVVHDRNLYLQKIDHILSDTSKFEKITKNPTNNIKNQANATISTINALQEATHFQKITGDFEPGYIYGTVKTHKPGNPLRPIISQIPTATYHLAKNLNKLLTPYTPSKYSLSSTTDFLEILRDAPPADDHIIASLDVESLFTNVPVQETIDMILKKVYHSEATPLNIPENCLRQLLSLCTKEAPFICPRGNMYKQIDGVAMGSPLGVLFANFYMGTIEEELLKTDRPPIYCRYVDDIFVRVRNTDELHNIQQRFKNASKLNFTFEEASNGQLPFLDTMVQSFTTGFSTTVYTKPTNNGMCLNGKSECPKRYLQSTISAYINRALTHCTTWNDTHQELERVTQVLVNNGFKNSDVTSTINRTLDKWYNNNNPQNQEGETIHFYYRTFMSSDHTTEEKVMKDIIRKNVLPTNPLDKIQFTIYYKTRKTSQLLLQNRPSTNKSTMQESGVVYQFTCPYENCGFHKYIGKTQTTLSRRLTMHLQMGAIKQHHTSPSHPTINRKLIEDNTSILDREKDPRRLNILEAIYITSLQPSLNIQSEFNYTLPSLRPLNLNHQENYNMEVNNHPTANIHQPTNNRSPHTTMQPTNSEVEGTLLATSTTNMPPDDPPIPATRRSQRTMPRPNYKT